MIFVKTIIDETDIIPSINSDHSAIVLHLNTIGKQNHGPSYWKFNNSLANDTDYVLMNQSIPVWLDEFKEVTDKRVLCPGGGLPYKMDGDARRKF